MLSGRNYRWCIAWLAITLPWSGSARCAPLRPPDRIVSLAPAMTELLYAMGLGDRVVGVTNVCDRPEEARAKTKVGGMTDPSLESIVALRPDLVVMIKEGNPKDLAARITKLKIKIHVFSAKRLVDIPPAIRELGNVLGVSGRAGNLARNIENAIRKGSSLRNTAKLATHKALFVISPSPLIVAGPGTIMDDAMGLSGLINIAADANTAYPVISLETVIRRQPDVIIIGSVRGMRGRAEDLLRRLKTVEAVRRRRVYYMSDSLYRPGPRIPEGLAELGRYAGLP